MLGDMVTLDAAPSQGKDAFDCPICGAFANQVWGEVTTFMQNSPRKVFSNGSKWTIALCQRCDGYSLWLGERQIYPGSMIGTEPSMDMPGEVQSLYNEARAVAVVSRRAGAAMARATLELLAKHVDPDAPKGASLVQRLDRIIPTVDSSLGQMLTFVRHVGNAIHVKDQPDDAVVLVLDEDQTAGMELIFAAVGDLVEEKITRPRVAAEMYSKIPESVRKRVEGTAQ
jgi:hypothetical protein